MKTAEQIAAEVADKFARHAHALDWEDGPKRRAYIIHAAQTAIEADRAQRDLGELEHRILEAIAKSKRLDVTFTSKGKPWILSLSPTTQEVRA